MLECIAFGRYNQLHCSLQRQSVKGQEGSKENSEWQMRLMEDLATCTFEGEPTISIIWS